jgi:uncharacterized membrane protein YoaK (UPF0700 family)
MRIVLGIHNIFRWLVLAGAVYAIYRMARGMITKIEWTDADRKSGLVFMILIDIQLLLGLILYFVFSPLIKTFFANFSTAMQDSTLRFWGIEHIGLMVVVAVMAHLGAGVAKKQISDADKFKRSTIFFVLVVLLLLAGIPWFRPLLPAF